MHPKNPLLVLGLLVVVMMAGCSDSSASTQRDDTNFDSFELAATASTGILRGVVFDEAIRPIPLVEITVKGADTNLSITTREDGAFGFDDLAPGTYFLSAQKNGFLAVQASTEVIAGVSAPAVLKIQLIADPAAGPRVDYFQFSGFIECSVRPMLLALDCGQYVPGTPPAGIERLYTFDTVPDWVQSEMLWKSTQSAGDELTLVAQCTTGAACPNGQLNLNSSEGKSPRIITLNQTESERWKLGMGDPYRLRAFVYGRSDMDVYNEQQVNDTLYSASGGQIRCATWPILFDPTTCIRATGPGIVLNQAFEIYTQVFYEFTPKTGWKYSVDGMHAIPTDPVR